MTPMTPEDVEKMVELVRKSVDNYRRAKNPALKINALDNFIFYLKIKLDNRYNDFLDFAFPEYAGKVVPAGLLVCADNLPELIRDFLTRS